MTDMYTQMANSPTPYREKAEAMGFKFGRAEVFEDRTVGYMLRGTFTCLCGTHEAYCFHIDEMAILDQHWQIFDPAWHLWRAGSFSKKHLLADGYSPEKVEEILQKGRDYDARKFSGPGRFT